MSIDQILFHCTFWIICIFPIIFLRISMKIFVKTVRSSSATVPFAFNFCFQLLPVSNFPLDFQVECGVEFILYFHDDMSETSGDWSWNSTYFCCDLLDFFFILCLPLSNVQSKNSLGVFLGAVSVLFVRPLTF